MSWTARPTPTAANGPTCDEHIIRDVRRLVSIARVRGGGELFPTLRALPYALPIPLQLLFAAIHAFASEFLLPCFLALAAVDAPASPTLISVCPAFQNDSPSRPRALFTARVLRVSNYIALRLAM